MLDPTNDLVSVADGVESVTLLRRGHTPGTPGTVIAHALRRAMTAVEAAIVNRGDVHKKVASGGQHTAVEVVWHLPKVELPDAPRLGDVILDGAGQRWTILEVKLATLGVRWRCPARNVAVAFGLDDTVSVLKTASVSGATIGRPWRTGIRARIQPIGTKIATSDTTSSTTVQYRIFVEENIEIDHTCRIRGADGTLYAIVGATGAERIGELQVIEAERSWSSETS